MTRKTRTTRCTRTTRRSRAARTSVGRFFVALSLGLVLGATAGTSASFADEPVQASADGAEEWGQIARVPGGPTDHRVWVNDRVLRHSLLFDADTGKMLGAVDSATGVNSRPPYLAPERGEVYVVETYYSQGLRGTRKDQVAVYDARRLEVIDQIPVPPKIADTGMGLALATVLDGERFLVVLNQSPGTSVSIVDLERRRFVEEVVTGGCALVYAAGPRSFGMLCGDGTALEVDLDEEGHHLRSVSSEPFFDVVDDPLTIVGGRRGTSWLFASFEGMLHEIDFSGATPVARPAWSLFSDAERDQGWRVGGVQHLAFHERSGRLYSVVHQGGPGSHKDAGPAIWVWDVEAHQRVAQIEAPNVLIPFMRPFLQIERDSFLLPILRWVLPPPGVHSIAVTQDEAPLLFARNVDLGAVGVIDAISGEHVRDLEEVGLSGPALVVP